MRSFPVVLLMFSTVLFLVEGLAASYSACGKDPSGDVCYGHWDVFGLTTQCNSKVSRLDVDITYARTSDDGFRVKFEIVLQGNATRSLTTVYGFKGTIGKGSLGLRKQIRLWVVDGTAYIMTDLTRQFLPARESDATTIEGNRVTIRIPKTDIGGCTAWEMRAFALKGESYLSPRLGSVASYFDEVVLKECSVPEPVGISLAILALVSGIGYRQRRGEYGDMIAGGILSVTLLLGRAFRSSRPPHC